MKVIILAGGGGKRLFPVSRKACPKQFLSIDKETSLLGETMLRYRQLARPEDMLIVTNTDYAHHVEEEIEICGIAGAHILQEPMPRNTMPAIVLAAQYCTEELGTDLNEVLFIAPADHVIRPISAFQRMVKRAEEMARRGHMVTFGISPTAPETGFGYIEAGEAVDKAYRISAFKEKPDLQTAKQYLERGNYYWNSGMFAFSIDCCLKEIEKHAPDVYAQMRRTYRETLQNFSAMPNISIDYAIAEKSSKGMMLPLDLYWNDVGSWDAVYDLLEKDKDGNAIRGNAIMLDCHGSLVYGQKRFVGCIGLQDIMVIETEDAVLVARRENAQRVKEMVTILKGMTQGENSSYHE